MASPSIEELRSRLVRTAFVPSLTKVALTEDAEDDDVPRGVDDVLVSKFGGHPLLTEAHWAPKLDVCGTDPRMDLQGEGPSIGDGNMSNIVHCTNCRTKTLVVV